MNCKDGVCKFRKNTRLGGVCLLDNSFCDYRVNMKNGMLNDTCHCNVGVLLPNDLYSDFCLACSVACKYYDSCDKD